MLKRILIITLLLSMGVMARPALAQGPAPDIVTGEIIVKVRPQLSGQAAQQVVRENGVSLLEASSRGGWLRLKVPAQREAEFVARLAARNEVEVATLNPKVYALGDPNDPDYGLQWYLHDGQDAGSSDSDIDAPEAWDIFTGSDNITIAVIDSGVDADHPDLQPNLMPGYDFYHDDPTPEDDDGHGTHVAGIAAAAGNNGLGIAGVSWQAKIMPLKILANGNGNTFDLAEAIIYAADHGAQVVNMSLGGTCTSAPHLDDAVAYAVSKGVLLVAASGNYNSDILCPAALAGVMAVGATDISNDRWFGSNFGAELDVVAPGASIYSTIPGGQYGYKTGTSMATPQVAGLAALIWSYDSTLTRTQVADTIRQTSQDLGDTGWDTFYGYGRINAYQALNSLNNLQPSTLMIDDTMDTATTVLELTEIYPASITWTATISPSVSWLEVSIPDADQTPAESSPVQVELVATQPPAYGTHTTTVILTATAESGPVKTHQVEVSVIYVPELTRLYFPLFARN